MGSISRLGSSKPSFFPINLKTSSAEIRGILPTKCTWDFKFLLESVFWRTLWPPHFLDEWRTHTTSFWRKALAGSSAAFSRWRTFFKMELWKRWKLERWIRYRLAWLYSHWTEQKAFADRFPSISFSSSRWKGHLSRRSQWAGSIDLSMVFWRSCNRGSADVLVADR